MISVIIPTYNRGQFLKDALESIQGVEELLEVIVGDDASSDDIGTICRNCQDALGIPIIHLRSEVRKGAQDARNRAMDQSKGSYLLFLDSDDLLVPAGVNQLLEKLAGDTSLDYCLGYVTKTDADLVPLNEGKVGGEFTSSPRDIAGYHWQTMGALYRRDYLMQRVGYWNLELTGSQDWEYQARVKLGRGNWEYVDTCVGYWRQHSGTRVGAKSFQPDYVRSVIKACLSIYRHAVKAGFVDSTLEKRLAVKIFVHAVEFGSNGYRKDRQIALKQMLECMPPGKNLNIRALAKLWYFAPGTMDSLALKLIRRSKGL